MMKTLLCVIGMMVTVVGCKTHHSQTSDTRHEQRDSIKYREVVRVDTLRIAADSVKVYVPLELIKRDTVLVYRNKWAQARVVIRDSIITLTANCDSLQRLVLSYERELYRSHAKTDQVKEMESIKTTRFLPWYVWAVGLLALLVLLIKSISSFKPF